MDAFRSWPRPLLINEDGVNLRNLDAAIEAYASRGYHRQGKGRHDPGYEAIWGPGERKTDVAS